MSTSEQERREREARRARRLAERAEQRARRKEEQARRASERAEQLAEQAQRRPRRDRDESFEDKVDAFAEKWERKAEAWFEDTAESLFDGGEDEDVAAAGGAGDGRRRRRTSEGRSESSARRRRRQRRAARRRRQRGRTFSSRFKSGRSLYRDKENGKICGVCAGFADYIDVAPWQVRLFAVLGLIFVPSMAVPTYFIAYFLMDDKPYYRRVTDRYDDDELDEAEAMNEEDEAREQQTREQRPEMSNAEAFRTAKQKFGDLEGRLRAMESHVTSSKFELQRELRKISGDDAS